MVKLDKLAQKYADELTGYKIAKRVENTINRFGYPNRRFIPFIPYIYGAPIPNKIMKIIKIITGKKDDK